MTLMNISSYLGTYKLCFLIIYKYYKRITFLEILNYIITNQIHRFKNKKVYIIFHQRKNLKKSFLNGLFLIIKKLKL